MNPVWDALEVGSGKWLYDGKLYNTLYWKGLYQTRLYGNFVTMPMLLTWEIFWQTVGVLLQHAELTLRAVANEVGA